MLRSSVDTLNAAVQHNGFIIYHKGKLHCEDGPDWQWIACPNRDEHQALSELSSHGYIKHDCVLDKYTSVFRITTEGKSFLDRYLSTTF